MVARCNGADLVNKLAGLALLPQYQANHPRILTLLNFALTRAKGVKRASVGDLDSMLNGLLGHAIGDLEDPAEDAFVSGAASCLGNHRIFNGIFSGSAFNLQRLIDTVFASDFPGSALLASQCRALLALSDAVAERNGLVVDQFADSLPRQSDWPRSLAPLRDAGQTACFTLQDLETLEIASEHIAPFVLHDVSELDDVFFYGCVLGQKPILRLPDGSLRIPSPCYVSPAIRSHLVQAISRGDIPHNRIESFHALQVERWLRFDLPLRSERVQPAGAPPVGSHPFDVPGYFSQSVVQFDEDKLAHLMVLGCDWKTPPLDVYDVRKAPKPLESNIQAHIQSAREELASTVGSGRGLSIVVYDSPGWSMNFDAGVDPDHEWFVAAASSYAFSTLLADPLFNLLDLWKMLRAERALRASGKRFVVWPDLLNRWSIWREWDFSLQPSSLDLRTFDLISTDTALVQGQVVQSRIIAGTRSLPTAAGAWLAVERMVRADGPELEFDKPIFYPPSVLARGDRTSVVETDLGAWWITMGRPPFSREELTYHYLLWQSATEWLLRLARTGKGRIGNAALPLEINLLPVPESIADAPADVQYLVHPNLPIVQIILPASLLETMASAGNDGERRLVRALAEAVAVARGALLDHAELDGWASEVTADPALKMMHVTFSNDPGSAVDLLVDHRRYRPIQAPDMSAASAGLRDIIASQPGSPMVTTSSTIVGETPVQGVLHACVDVHWRRCQERLGELDRVSTLVLISRMIEALLRDRAASERSALAVTRLYENSEDWAVLTVARRDVTYRAYRVAAEMANCACPLNDGRKASLSDIDHLAAEISALIDSGENSDAVRFKLIEARLEFLPNGGWRMAQGGAQTLMRNYLTACIGESIELDIEHYPALYGRETVDRRAFESDDDGFLRAFELEFGLSFLDAVRITNGMRQLCVDHADDVAVLRQSELVSKLRAEMPELDETTPRSFLQSFGLVSRARWDAPPPEPWHPDDIWPWHFERRLSLMLRPAIISADETDPTIVYGVRQLDMGMRYASTLLELAVWPKGKLQSAEARAFVDAEINRRGSAFEAEVASLVRGAGWRALGSQPMKRLGASAKFGDIDVLAISPDGCQWITIECKWFGAARTPREIANWLQDYHGKSGDKLDRHLQRHTWIDENKEAVAKVLNLEIPETVLGRVVTTSPVPLAFRSGLPTAATVWTRREVVARLAGLQHTSAGDV